MTHATAGEYGKEKTLIRHLHHLLFLSLSLSKRARVCDAADPTHLLRTHQIHKMLRYDRHFHLIYIAFCLHQTHTLIFQLFPNKLISSCCVFFMSALKALHMLCKRLNPYVIKSNAKIFISTIHFLSGSFVNMAFIHLNKFREREREKSDRKRKYFYYKRMCKHHNKTECSCQNAQHELILVNECLKNSFCFHLFFSTKQY